MSESETRSTSLGIPPKNEAEWKEYLRDLEAREATHFFSREDVIRLLEKLGNPQDKVPSIHIVGTNGKGSVGAMLASIISSASKCVGHTSSPHLYNVSERCFIDGVPRDPILYRDRIRRVSERAKAEGMTPTFFVLSLLASFEEFRDADVDWMVIEAGLGGRDDATNVLGQPRANVLTSVGYDHMDILGHSLSEIAEKKAGIAKPEVPFFIGAVPVEVISTVERVAQKASSPIYLWGEEYMWDEKSETLKTSDGSFSLSLQDLGLKAAYQRRNAILSSRVAFGLGFSETEVHTGLRKVRWPGRCEELHVVSSQGQVRVMLDVAHNAEGMGALAEELNQRANGLRQIVFLVSMLDRKDYKNSLEQLLNFKLSSGSKRHWICTSSGHSQARRPETLAAYLRGLGEQDVLVEENPEKALQSASELLSMGSLEEGLIVVLGSVFLVGKLRPLLTSQPITTLEK